MSPTIKFPDRVDPRRGTITLVSTTADQLRAMTFLDGRTPVGNGRERLVRIDDLPKCQAKSPVGMLLHVAFCGSTLLSRLLDVPGKTLVLREPRVQIDLADWLAVFAEGGLPVEWQRAVHGTTALLGIIGGEERVVVKPTNWANVLLPTWSATVGTINPVFITMEPRAFITAVFRGGRERLGFTMRAAGHFASVRSDGGSVLAEALARSADPLDRAAHLVVATLGFQLALFDKARLMAGWGEERVIGYAALRADPAGIALRVARLLDLPLNGSDIAARAADLSGRDAKAPNRSFAPADERERDAVVSAHHGARIDAALRWGERAGLL